MTPVADEELEIQESTEEEVVDDDTGSDESSEEEVDYKALYEAEKAQREKAENDRKAALGAQKSQRERDDELFAIRDNVEALTKTVGLLVKSTASGDTDGLEEGLVEVQKTVTTSNADRIFRQQFETIREGLEEALTDEEGNALIDLKEHPEWVKEWQEAGSKRDMATLSRLSIEAQAMARRAEREKTRTLLEQAKKEKQEGKKAERRKKADMDLGPANGGAAERDNKSSIARIQQGLEKRPDLLSR